MYILNHMISSVPKHGCRSEIHLTVICFSDFLCPPRLIKFILEYFTTHVRNIINSDWIVCRYKGPIRSDPMLILSPSWMLFGLLRKWKECGSARRRRRRWQRRRRPRSSATSGESCVFLALSLCARLGSLLLEIVRYRGSAVLLDKQTSEYARRLFCRALG